MRRGHTVDEVRGSHGSLPALPTTAWKRPPIGHLALSQLFAHVVASLHLRSGDGAEDVHSTHYEVVVLAAAVSETQSVLSPRQSPHRSSPASGPHSASSAERKSRSRLFTLRRKKRADSESVHTDDTNHRTQEALAAALEVRGEDDARGERLWQRANYSETLGDLQVREGMGRGGAHGASTLSWSAAATPLPPRIRNSSTCGGLSRTPLSSGLPIGRSISRQSGRHLL